MSGLVRKKFLSAAEPGKKIFCPFPVAEHSVYVSWERFHYTKRKETHNSNFAMMRLEDNNAIK